MADWVDLLSQNNQQISPATQANIGLTQATTAGQNLQNQRTALQLDFLRQLAGGAGASPGAPPAAPGAQPGQPMGLATPGQQADMEASGDMSVDAANARQFARQNFAPVPAVWSPQELKQLQLADLSGTPGARDAVVAAHDKRFESINGTRSYAANQFYTDAYAVANAPDGQALNTLKLLQDPAAQQLADAYERAGLDDDQVRQHASQLAAISYQEGRLPVTYKEDGVARDMEGREIPGYGQSIGLSAQQIADRVKAGEQPAPGDFYDRDGHKVPAPPMWQFAGFHSIQDYVHAGTEAAARRGMGMGPGAPVGAPPAAATNGGTPMAAAPAPGAPPAVNRSIAPPPKPPATSPNAVTTGGVLDLSDADASPMAKRTGGSLTPGESKYQTDAIDINKAAGGAVSSAQFNMMEGRQILQVLPQAATGPGTAAWARVQTGLQNLFGSKAAMTGMLGDPGARQALEKLLGQDAIASTEKEMKESGGGSLRGGAQLMNLAMNKLNASPEMARNAIAAITKYTMDQSAYEAQKWGPDFGRYRAAGKDVTDFDRWYESKYTKSRVVPPVVLSQQPGAGGGLQEGATGTSKSGKPIVVKGGQWVYQ